MRQTETHAQTLSDSSSIEFEKICLLSKQEATELKCEPIKENIFSKSAGKTLLNRFSTFEKLETDPLPQMKQQGVSIKLYVNLFLKK